MNSLQLPAWPYKRWRMIHVQQFPESLVLCPPCWILFFFWLSRDFLSFFFKTDKIWQKKLWEEEMNSYQEFHSLRVVITVCWIFERPSFKSFAKKALVHFTTSHKKRMLGSFWLQSQISPSKSCQQQTSSKLTKFMKNCFLI